MTTLKLTKIPKLNLMIIKQTGGKFFLTSQDSIIIDEAGFYQLIKVLLDNDMINAHRLIGIAEYGGDSDVIPEDLIHSRQR